MVIDAVDIYWARVPLAFVWKTSYADQRATDTILVRMQSGRHHAWGESCPPYIPAYSAEHTLATFHTLREHLAPRIVGHDLRSAPDLLGRFDFVKGNQFARAALEIAWWVLEAKRLDVPLHVALGGKGEFVAVGADFGIQDSLDILMQKIQGAIGGAICAELATLPNFTYPADIFPSSYFYDNDLGKPELALAGRGLVATSCVPGIAQEPDPDLLARWTVAHASFRAEGR